jgi:nitroreductase
MSAWKELFNRLQHRFGDAFAVIGSSDWPGRPTDPPELWNALSMRGSVRSFHPTPPAPGELDTIAALALAAPTKSDLQQRDIILITDPDQMERVKKILGNEAWVSGSPALAVFCANNRRQRILHEMRGHKFANDHLDAFFNASVDAAIVLATFVLAAEAAGFGTCPISAIRNKANEASDILGLPDHVFPIAGLAVGSPAEAAEPSLRLPLSLTIHQNRYMQDEPHSAIDEYDRRRAELQPYEKQRKEERFGNIEPYTWSEDKSRQYSFPERSDFGAFIRGKGFLLD